MSSRHRTTSTFVSLVREIRERSGPFVPNHGVTTVTVFRSATETFKVGSLYCSVVVDFTNPSPPHRHDPWVRPSPSSPSLGVPSVKPTEKHTVDTVQPPGTFKSPRSEGGVGLPSSMSLTLSPLMLPGQTMETLDTGSLYLSALTGLTSPTPSHRHDPRVRTPGTSHSMSSPPRISGK